MRLRPAALLALATIVVAACGAREALANPGADRPKGGWVSSDGEVAVLAPTIVLPKAVVEHDILEIGANVQVYGIVKGDVLALCGDIYVFGRLEGDAMAVFGRVIVRGEDASLVGDVAVVGGNVSLQDGGVVSGQTRVSLPLPEGQKPSYLALSTRPEVLILRLAVVACWTLLALIAAFSAPNVLVRSSLAMRRRLPRMLVIGALFHLSALLTAILFTALIALFVGAPLLGLLVLALVVVEAMAFGAAFHDIGERVIERFSSVRASGYAKLLLGALILSCLSFIPILGEILWAAAACAGSGAFLVSWSRRRRER